MPAAIFGIATLRKGLPVLSSMVYISKDYENVAEGSKLQVVPNSACSRFQRDKLNWNNLQLRTFNSSFSNAFCTKIFIISGEDIHIRI
jgi:hypothetical protein